MKKSTLKYLIDVLPFVDIISIAAIGILLGFVIPTGRQVGQEKFLLGLHCHEWGDIPLYLSALPAFAFACSHLVQQVIRDADDQAVFW